MNIKINDTDIQKLNSAVEYLLEQEFFSSAVSRLKEELAQSSETFVWASVDLGSIPVELPANIKSCWIFHLRKDVPSGAHCHPNSIQHMFLVGGQGMSHVGDIQRLMIPFASPVHPPAQKLLIIGVDVPHEFIPEKEDMTVLSFHTCNSDELREIECENGGARLYEGPDS